MVLLYYALQIIYLSIHLYVYLSSCMFIFLSNDYPTGHCYSKYCYSLLCIINQQSICLSFVYQSINFFIHLHIISFLETQSSEIYLLCLQAFVLQVHLNLVIVYIIIFYYSLPHNFLVFHNRKNNRKLQKDENFMIQISTKF